MRLLVVVALVLVFAGMALFAQHNGQTTDLSFLYWSWSRVPIWAPAVASSAIVLGLGMLYVLFGGIRWRLRHRRLQRGAEKL